MSLETSPLTQRGLDLVRMADKPHGTRVRYMAGRCRCTACRKANSAYENERQRARRNGDWNGIVDAAPARDHLRKLSKAGVGRVAVNAATDIAVSVIDEIRIGKRTRVRARTLRKILAVTRAQACDHALQGSARAHKLIALMLDEGYTKQWIAEQLGYRRATSGPNNRPALQFKVGHPITVRNAARIENLWRRIST